MATGRTISASFLTALDQKVLELCKEIANALINSITNRDLQREFKNDFAKISQTRDAGAGRGGGKLQRDALTTRGIQGKAPFSNRNFRWHPLVVSQNAIPFAKTIERIEIEATTLNFIVKHDQGELVFPADRVHEMPKRYTVLPSHWFPHIETLKNWSDVEWTQNSCVITAYEACNWYEAVEAYAVLGISIVVGMYEVDFETIYAQIIEILSRQTIDNDVTLPQTNFPTNKNDIISCPLCKTTTSQNPAQLPNRVRESRWKPEWIDNKRGEGEDGSLQIMHVEPLAENQIKHNAQNVRFGHRWCNVAMTDHSITETLDFMQFIVTAHNRI
ncbi:MAG TPA: hypothetical protein PKH93_08235 [Chitinophagales bacterium]|nr:hypothetical protein [Chitinophagales bacterium]HNL07547.1 hypothetical protein [Chitinophagales bacterium]